MVEKEIRVTTGDLISVQEAAKQLGRPRITIYRWIEKNKIAWIRFGGILFIPQSEVERIAKVIEEGKQRAARL